MVSHLLLLVFFAICVSTVMAVLQKDDRAGQVRLAAYIAAGFVGTALVCGAIAMAFGGMLALYIRFRQSTLNSGGTWRADDQVIPEVPTNLMLLSFAALFVFAQWAVYAARRAHTLPKFFRAGLVHVAHPRHRDVFL